MKHELLQAPWYVVRDDSGLMVRAKNGRLIYARDWSDWGPLDPAGPNAARKNEFMRACAKTAKFIVGITTLMSPENIWHEMPVKARGRLLARAEQHTELPIWEWDQMTEEERQSIEEVIIEDIAAAAALVRSSDPRGEDYEKAN